MKRCFLFKASVLLAQGLLLSSAQGYVLNRTVADVRDNRNAGLGACPKLNRFFIGNTGEIPVNRQWSTSTIPPDIITVATDPTARKNEVENVIIDSFGVWTGVTFTALNSTNNPGALGQLGTTPTQNACTNDTGTNFDGLNTICLNQSRDRKSTRLNSSHPSRSRMPSSA